MGTTYILITTKHGKIKLVSAMLKKMEEIKEIAEVYGRYDIIVKVQTGSDEDFKRFMQNKIRLVEDIEKTETLIVSDEAKQENNESWNDAEEEENEEKDDG